MHTLPFSTSHFDFTTAQCTNCDQLQKICPGRGHWLPRGADDPSFTCWFRPGVNQWPPADGFIRKVHHGTTWNRGWRGIAKVRELKQHPSWLWNDRKSADCNTLNGTLHYPSSHFTTDMMSRLIKFNIAYNAKACIYVWHQHNTVPLSSLHHTPAAHFQFNLIQFHLLVRKMSQLTQIGETGDWREYKRARENKVN